MIFCKINVPAADRRIWLTVRNYRTTEIYSLLISYFSSLKKIRFVRLLPKIILRSEVREIN